MTKVSVDSLPTYPAACFQYPSRAVGGCCLIAVYIWDGIDQSQQETRQGITKATWKIIPKTEANSFAGHF